LWQNAWADFVPFLAFDAEIRTVVCSTNAIESVNPDPPGRASPIDTVTPHADPDEPEIIFGV
jgi:transposase-like protein